MHSGSRPSSPLDLAYVFSTLEFQWGCSYSNANITSDTKNNANTSSTTDDTNTNDATGVTDITNATITNINGVNNHSYFFRHFINIDRMWIGNEIVMD